jgi:hypothetical protein
MKKTLLYIGAFVILTACDSGAKKEESKDSEVLETQTEDEGWISLFDGGTTNGWHTYGKEVVGEAWIIEDGVLKLDASNKEGRQTNGGGDITTDEEFDNFHLKLEWKISQNGNSGIIFYVNEDVENYKNTYNTGLEMQVLDNDGHADGKIHKHRAADLYDLIAAEEATNPVGEWNLAEIISKDGSLEFFMNGKKVLETTLWDEKWEEMVQGSKFAKMPGFGKFQKGKIALQDHGDDVWYRNIMIKRL